MEFEDSASKIIIAGLLGGFIGNAILGVLFTNPISYSILYNPDIQSELFIEITPQRDVPLSVVGLVLLSVIHSILYSLFRPSIPGDTWFKKGIFWGITIWAMYWLFQEWFIYNTLLKEPVILNIFELILLLIGSIAEGIVIARILRTK